MPQRPPGGKVNAANLNYRGLDALAAVLGTEVIAVSPVGDGPNESVLLSQIMASGGQVDSVVGGTNIDVDAGDPVNPIVNLPAAIAGVSVNGVSLSGAGAATAFLNETGAYSVPAGGGQVDSVVGGANIGVDITDPVNPIVNLDAAIAGVSVNGVSLSGAGAATSYLDETGAYSVPAGGSVPDPLQLSNGSAAAPAYSFSAETSLGIYRNGAGLLAFNGSRFEGNNANGPALLNEAPLGTNPTLVPDKTDPDTGLGLQGADNLAIIAGGEQIALCVEAAGNKQMIFALQNNELAPSIAFGDGNSGFYEVIDNLIGVTLNGDIKFSFGEVLFQCSVTNGFAVKNELASAINPVHTIQGDNDTGMGWISPDLGALCAGGVNVMQFGEVGAAPTMGFFGTTAIAKPTGVAVSSAGIHAALVSLGLIAA